MKGKIFVSYRRQDSLGSTGRLYDRLINHFSPDKIFMDIDNIKPGEDFVEVIEEAVSKCDVLVVVIGRHWLTFTDKNGKRLLDKPEDFVRTEIRTALNRNIKVIPVLVENALIPTADDLPDDIKPLSRRNAIEITYTRFNTDTEKLVGSLKTILDEAAANAYKKEELFWNDVQNENTEKAYRQYIINYPDGKFIREASKRIYDFVDKAEKLQKKKRIESTKNLKRAVKGENLTPVKAQEYDNNEIQNTFESFMESNPLLEKFSNKFLDKKAIYIISSIVFLLLLIKCFAKNDSTPIGYTRYSLIILSFCLLSLLLLVKFIHPQLLKYIKHSTTSHYLLLNCILLFLVTCLIQWFLFVMRFFVTNHYSIPILIDSNFDNSILSNGQFIITSFQIKYDLVSLTLGVVFFSEAIFLLLYSLALVINFIRKGIVKE